MGRKLVLTIVAVALLILFVFPIDVWGEISVGVKAGDWIEYHVATTGNPPEEHNVTWSRLEILQVQGSQIKVNVTSQARNGTVSSLIMTLNIEKGQIGAWWIIPSNLNPGQTFYDDFLKQHITINGEEQLQYAGATRTITNATVPTRVKQWDKVTGVFVLSSDDLPGYTINVVAYGTNMWSPQTSGLNPTIFYVIALAIALAIIAFVGVMFFQRRNKQNASPK